MIRTPWIFLALGCVLVSAAHAVQPKWTGKGACRTLVKIDPVGLGDRTSDELVAQVPLDFTAILKEQKISGQTDLSTIQVHKYNPETGDAEKFKPFETSVSEYDRPCRFEDNAVPDDYPDNVTHASLAENGRGPTLIRKRGGRLFNREMDNSSGNITWVHTQIAGAASYYAIYWDVKATLAECGPSPAPWIGDADVYRLKDGQSLGGLSHFTACAGDFNGDGMFDLFAGAEKGDLMWFPNHGTPGHPKFVGCRMLVDEKGAIDVGWYGAPFWFDWDNDGVADLLVGTSTNVILWWKNIGRKDSPKLSSRGFVRVDEHRLEVPIGPVPEDNSGIFKHDYYNQPWVGDWDGDGIPDILTGGYTTGQIFYYRGVGRNEDGTPRLRYVGPLEADGNVLDTVWGAAPFAYDLDNDGKNDLITGSWFWSGIHRPQKPGETEFLMYYHNVGTPGNPKLQREPLPHTGKFPDSHLARPSIVDWNGDGLPDLMVSDDTGLVYYFLNTGKPGSPNFEVNETPLATQWGFVRSSHFGSRGVLAPDGVQDLLSGQHFNAYEGSPYSPHLVHRGSVSVNGKPINYPGPGYGDAYAYTTMADWDHDGHPDLIYGTQQGNIYLHRNLGDKNPYAFGEGVQFKLKSGEVLRLGPPVVDSPDKVKDFTALQGSRVVMSVADFDGDGIDDLVVSETFGNIWIFLNKKQGATGMLEPGVNIGKVFGSNRTNDLGVIDWNEDGKPDLMIGTPLTKPGSIYLNQSTPGHLQFAKPIQPLDLPFMFWGPIFKPIDWNHDGDQDFLVFSEFYAFYVEQSFLLHGYRPGLIIGAPERRLERP